MDHIKAGTLEGFNFNDVQMYRDFKIEPRRGS